MLSSLSTKLFSLAFLSLIGGSIVINSKLALWAEPSAASSPVPAPSIVQLDAKPKLSDRPATCNAYPLHQCLTP